jgi:hypothetical protein
VVEEVMEHLRTRSAVRPKINVADLAQEFFVKYAAVTTTIGCDRRMPGW